MVVGVRHFLNKRSRAEVASRKVAGLVPDCRMFEGGPSVGDQMPFFRPCSLMDLGIVDYHVSRAGLGIQVNGERFRRNMIYCYG
jgi:hypothetical protein